MSTEDWIVSATTNLSWMRTVSASDEDVRHFRQIRIQQKRTQLDHWLDHGPGTCLRKTLARINKALGNPGRFLRSVQAAILGTYRSGAAVAARHKIGIATQFLQIFAEAARSGIWFEEYYLYQLYLPERWLSRTRQFPTYSQSGPAQLLMIEHTRSPDFQFIQQKDLFAARCKEAELPHVPLLGQFIDGHPSGTFEKLPATDLFSKPARQRWGIGAEAWRYDQSHGCFVNVATDEKFSSDALLVYLCDLSRSGRVILQQRLRNYASLLPLTNGALSTLRIVTCTTPSGSIDLLPAFIRMPVGRLVVDNFSQGGLAAPIDFATGTICGPALQMDSGLGAIRLNVHPDTGQRFEGFSVPMWLKAVELARLAHKRFSSLHFISWDIAILKDGPVLLEGNAPANINGPVLTHGLALSDTQFIPYYNYHWANSVLKNMTTLRPQTSDKRGQVPRTSSAPSSIPG
jgi:Sugar-transfer associated ATP-grasp